MLSLVATAGEEIENPQTGERVKFVRTTADTGGELLELELVWTREGQRALEHIHPGMEERYEVLDGTAAFRIDGVESTARPGDVVTVPPGTQHLAWNPTPEQVRLRVQFRPPLRWEEFVERLFTLVREGADGAAIGALLQEFRREIVVPPPP